IEHHFALEGQRRFHGLMAGYLRLFTRVKYVGSTLRVRVPFMPQVRQGEQAPPPSDLSMFTRACSEVAANRQLDARGKALVNRLLVEADQQGFPLAVLTGPVEALGLLDWRQRYAGALSEVLQQVERQWTRPGGVRRVSQSVVVFLANWVPLLALLAALVNLLWRWTDPMGHSFKVDSFDLVMVPVVVLVALVVLHLLIALLLPLRWSAIRGEFRKQLEARLQQDLEGTYAPVPGDVADGLRAERRLVDKLIADTHEVASWLEQ